MKRMACQLATLFLAWIVAIPAAHAREFAVIYSGKDTVDLSVGTIDADQKIALYRGTAATGTLLRTWDARNSPSLAGQDLYFADTEPGSSYQLLTYGWECNREQECDWGEPSEKDILSIDRTREYGTLHNGDAWLGVEKLGRNPVAWKGDYAIKHVVLADGTLMIMDAHIVFDDANNPDCPFDTIIDARQGANISAYDSDFSRPAGQTNNGDIYLVDTSGNASALSWFIRCTFDNITLRGQAHRFDFEDNAFKNSDIYLSGATRDTAFVDNAFSSSEVALHDCEDVVIRANAFSDTEIFARGMKRLLMEDNTATSSEKLFINFMGSDSTIRRNTGVVRTSFGGGNNLIGANTFHTISFANGSGNTIEGNSAASISLEGYGHSIPTRSNTLRKNTVHHIEVRVSAECGENNVIEDNDISGVGSPFTDDRGRTGIYMFTYNPEKVPTTGNTVRGNRIDACRIGIHLADSDNNTVRDNDLLNTVSHGILLENASANSIIGNSITGPGSSGIYLDGGAASCDLWNFCDPATHGSKKNVIAFNSVQAGKRDGIECSGYAHGNDENGIHENVLRDNARYGIYIGGGTSNEHDFRNLQNTIYNNIIERNIAGNAVDSAINQTLWNKPKTEINGNIVGGSYLAGNFWGDYAGADTDRDGLGDSPYIIKAASGSDAAVQDALPLVKIQPGDLNDDGTIDLADAVLALQVAAGLRPEGLRLAADVNGDGSIGLPEVIYIVQRLAQ